MIRSEIVKMFRTENPELTSHAISDTLLYEWCLVGDKEVCARSRCIVSTITFTCAINDESWDLTSKDANFYDIDEYPGGGVSYNGKRIKKTTKALLDAETPTWRSRSASTPKEYYRRGSSIYVDRPCLAAVSIAVDAIMISNDWNSDVAPYNQLTYLEPFHYGINKFLQWKAKEKMGKLEDGVKAKAEFIEYTLWMKKELGGGKYAPIYYVPQH